MIKTIYEILKKFITLVIMFSIVCFGFTVIFQASMEKFLGAMIMLMPGLLAISIAYEIMFYYFPSKETEKPRREKNGRG